MPIESKKLTATYDLKIKKVCYYANLFYESKMKQCHEKIRLS